MKRHPVRQEALLQAVAGMAEAELAALTYTSLVELAYRHRTSVADMATRVEAPSPWEPRADAASGEVRPRLTLAGEIWERVTGRRATGLSRRRAG